MLLRNLCRAGLLAGLFVLVSACGRQPGKVTVTTPDGNITITDSGVHNTVIKTDKGDVTINTKGDTFVAKSKEGELAVGGSLSLPKDFPKDVPVYPGAKVLQSLATPKGHHLVLTTTDPVNKVWDFYADKLSKDGWMKQAQLQTGDGGVISGKKDNRICATNISKGEDAVTISLTVAVE